MTTQSPPTNPPPTPPASPTGDPPGDVFDQNLQTLVRMADPAAIDPAARDRIRARLIAQHAPGARAGAGRARPRRERSRVAMFGWGLALAAAGALVIANLRGGGHRAAPGSAPTDHLALTDGTTVEVGDGARVTVLGERRVRVDGTALLDVAPGQGRFVVETANGQLTVLGTRFLVEASPERTTAAVLRGVVAMRSAGGEAVVRAGEQGTMTSSIPPTRGPAPRLSHLVSWVAERRRRDEVLPPAPARSGVLLARNPQWQDQEFPLPMRSLELDIHLENQVARVALDQTFHNPQAQTLEGVYKFSLPPDAAVSRLAMYIDGKLTESAVVERMRARRIYEDIVYQRRDPALLEQMGASKVSMRVFPLPPHQDKRLILAYTQPLARTYDDETLTVPLPELDNPVEKVDMRVKVVGCGDCELSSPSHAIEVERSGGDAVIRHRGAAEKLGDSLIVRIRRPNSPAVQVASTIADAQRYLLVRVRPDVDPALAPSADDRPHRWIILTDTSASRGLMERRAQAELVDHLIQDIDEHDQVMVIAFDATHRRLASWQDAIDVDRQALHRHLVDDGGLGETDLGDALAGAVKLLDGEPGHIVYVGDGIATGERRTIDQLRDAVTGKATFIGIGVGDGVELPTLSALADATGGMAVHVDLGDDLAWRALDLVAALYTPRVVGLTAGVDLDSGSGDPVAAIDVTTYLRSAQVAAGEDIELVARVPVRAQVRRITLNGTLGTRAWSQTVTVADAARAPGDAGYLPRLWARRRIEALMTAGDRALAPCTTDPCPSDQERAVAAYHARKAEVVALGKEHFLLSMHTSLIVLENDAMYRQYGVTKGDGRTWAPYQAPATIAVNAAPVAPVVVDDQPVWRMPPAWFPGDVMIQAGLESGFMADGYRVGGGTVGLGKFGAIGHGSGTGAGYGAVTRGTGSGAGGTGAGRGGLRGRRASASAAATSGVLATVPVAGGDAESADEPAGQPITETLSDSAAAAFDEDAADAPMDATQLELTTSPAGAVVTGESFREADRWNNRLDDVSGNTASFHALGPVESKKRSRGGWERQQRWSNGWSFGQQAYWSGLNPVAFHYSGDWHLDDVTAWLPGFARLDYDDLADGLDAAAASERGAVTDAARSALDAARARVRPGRWRWADGAELIVDGAGRMQRSQTLEVGTREVMTYDGDTLTFAYPDLGLATTRQVAAHEPAVLAAFLPVMPPRADDLARWYRVTMSGTRTIHLAPAAGRGAEWELDLGDDGLVAAMRRVDGDTTTPLLATERDGAGYRVTIAGQRIALAYTADPAISVSSPAPAAVTIQLPLAASARVAAEVRDLTAGDPAWRTAMHQLAASALAQNDVSTVGRVAVELHGHGGLSAAELALCGAGLPYLAPGDRRGVLADASGPLADYLDAAAQIRQRSRAKLFSAVADRADGIVATLADHRETLVAIERGDAKAAVATFDRFMTRHPHADTLALIAATRLASTYYWRDRKAVAVLDRVATGPWRNLVRAQAARYAQYDGRGHNDAADRWAALLSDVDLDAIPPFVDWSARSAIAGSARGQLGWQLVMSTWKQKVLAGGDLDHVMAFATAAALEPGDDLDAALDRAATLAGSADQLAGVIVAATNWGRLDRAASILDRAQTRYPDSTDLLRLASTVAERRGDTRTAADLLARTMVAGTDEPIALSQLRADYGRLIGLYGAVARTATGNDRQTAVAAALAAGRDWRALDPDLATRERMIGELLLAVGEDDEAWRYLSTPIDLAPREGSSFQVPAEALERQGKLAQAHGLWWRAFAIDATNPTWLQRAAQVELAMGKKAEARATLERIAKGHWHVRWDGVKYWAQNALRQQ